MICVGDYVLYKQEGVCRVADFGERTMTGFGRHTYYTLKPISYDGTIYAPAEAKAHMRAVLTLEQAAELLAKAPRITPQVCESRDKKAVLEFCHSLIDPDDCESFVRAMKTISSRRGQKVLSGPEEEVYRRAERCLVEELSIALSLSLPEAKAELDKALGQA